MDAAETGLPGRPARLRKLLSSFSSGKSFAKEAQTVERKSTRHFHRGIDAARFADFAQQPGPPLFCAK
jgi:hypothetical protein